MGILNVTPDSFSDGGEHFRGADDAIRFAIAQLIDSGAAIVDVGGESTRPGAQSVAPDEQIRRVVPVISAIAAARPDAVISIDTTRAEVARRALAAGARMINDQSAGLDDGGQMLDLAAQSGARLVLMHRLRLPASDRFSDQYANGDEPSYGVGDCHTGMFESVLAFLINAVERAERAGVKREQIIVDPGLGFGKTVAQNFELMRRAGELQTKVGGPVLTGASRKSFLGAVSGLKRAKDRDGVTIAVNLHQYLSSGIRMFRVHDAAGHAQAFTVSQVLQQDYGCIDNGLSAEKGE